MPRLEIGSEFRIWDDLPFDDGFVAIVTAQSNVRQHAKVNRLIKTAALREPGACLEHLDSDSVRKLKKSAVAQILTANG